MGAVHISCNFHTRTGKRHSKDTYPVSLVQGFVWHLVGVLQMALLCTHSHKEIARKLGLENADVEYWHRLFFRSLHCVATAPIKIPQAVAIGHNSVGHAFSPFSLFFLCLQLHMLWMMSLQSKQKYVFAKLVQIYPETVGFFGYGPWALLHCRDRVANTKAWIWYTVNCKEGIRNINSYIRIKRKKCYIEHRSG